MCMCMSVLCACMYISAYSCWHGQEREPDSDGAEVTESVCCRVWWELNPHPL